jgi:hypothetical protein
MTDTLAKALDAVGEAPRYTGSSDLRQFFHGQRVVELGGDSTVFKVVGFDHTASTGWQAKIARVGCIEKSEYRLIPISKIKPADQITVH